MSPPENPIDALALHDRSLRALARSLLADVHAAEDVAQDAWLAALEHGGETAPLPRWLTGVVRNLAGKLRRGEERRARREHDAARAEAGPSTAEILAREAARARVVQAVLALERGFDVAGVVLDPLGDPVDGAEVWLSFTFTDEEGMVVACTGADGRFSLRACTGGALGARALRFAPSLLQTLRANEGSALALVLMGPGGELTGRVLDAEGALVPSAFVFVEPLGFKRRAVTVPLGGTREVSGGSAPAQDARTDATGRFVVRGLEPGVRRIAVRAAGHALWRGEAEVFAHGSSTLAVQLALGVKADVGGTRQQPVLRISAASGTTLVEEDLWLRKSGDYGLDLALAPGVYQVEARLPDGRRAGAELRVEAGEKAALALEPL